MHADGKLYPHFASKKKKISVMNVVVDAAYYVGVYTSDIGPIGPDMLSTHRNQDNKGKDTRG